jgi:ABC-type uncharacterized transport system involved in gliding motility auxiliary subunit
MADTANKSRSRIRRDAAITLMATIGIAVLANAILIRTSARIDLTETKQHTLSAESEEAARSLEGVAITVYISKRLPESIPSQAGKISLKGVDRAFRDKIEEYVSASGGKIRLTYADVDVPNAGTVEEQAEAAKLELFSSTEAQVEGNQLKFARFALGATFNYKAVSEVLPKALEPGFLEFEITKRLLRLKDKHEQSKLMKDVLVQGKKLHDIVKSCREKLDEITKEDGADQSAGLDLTKLAEKKGGVMAKVEAGKAELDKVCEPVAQALADARGPLEGRSEFVDNLLQSTKQFYNIYAELGRYLSGKGQAEVPKEAAVPQLVTLLGQVAREVEQRHQTLVDSPGQKRIGFVCGHMEFCPFKDREGLIDSQMAAQIQNNSMMKQIGDVANQIAGAIDQTNARVGDGLFVKQGYAIVRIDSGTPVPDDVSALIIYAPRAEIPAYDRYQIDQFLLSGRPVAAFAQQWEVSINNMLAPPELGQDARFDLNEVKRTKSNLAEMLAPYGVVLGVDMVIDPRHTDTVRVMELVNRGGMKFQAERDFASPMIPVFTEFDREHALTRSVQTMSIPYATTVGFTDQVKADKRYETYELIKSSSDALTRSADLAANPVTLQQAVINQPGTGPHTVAVVLRGPLKSAFVGKEVPHRPKPRTKANAFGPLEKDETPEEYELNKRKQVNEGTGRLFVVASNMGLEGLSREAVLPDFNVAALMKFSVEGMMQYGQWQANFQNWQLRIQQVSHLLQDNLRFLSNVMDWATAHGALADIRSKGDSRRPMREVKPDEARTLRLAALVGTPLVLIILGFLRARYRRKRIALAAARTAMAHKKGA